MLQEPTEFDLEEQEEIGCPHRRATTQLTEVASPRLSSPTFVISIMAEVLRDQIHRSHFCQNLAQPIQVGLHKGNRTRDILPPQGKRSSPQGSLSGETTPVDAHKQEPGLRLRWKEVAGLNDRSNDLGTFTAPWAIVHAVLQADERWEYVAALDDADDVPWVLRLGGCRARVAGSLGFGGMP